MAGVVRTYVGDVGSVVEWLAEGSGWSDLKSVGRLAMSVLGGSEGAVGGCRWLESSVAYVLDVEKLRIDVKDLVRVGVLVWTVRILPVLNNIGSVGRWWWMCPMGLSAAAESRKGLCWRCRWSER